MIDFEGQVVIVTGAGRGLGRLYAKDIARRAGSVVVNDIGATMAGEGRDPRVADQVVEEIAREGGIAVASCESVASPDGGEAIVATALERFGRVDAVVSNAGIFGTEAFEDLTPEAWRQMLAVHLDGSFHLSQPAFRVMKAQGYGRFVFVASSAGLFGMPGEAHYAAAKAGIFGLTNVLALEGAQHGILANCLLPTGYSRMAAQTAGAEVTQEAEHLAIADAFKRAIDPELVVPMVTFLASRACDFTHRSYAACAGRYSRVFVGLGEGWLAEEGSKPTADDIAANLAKVSATDRFTIPSSIFDEVAEACTLRGIGA